MGRGGGVNFAPPPFRMSQIHKTTKKVLQQIGTEGIKILSFDQLIY